MNAFKKFMKGSKGDDSEDGQLQKEKRLCLQHLRRLFLEYLHPREYVSQEQQEAKLYLMLPLFIKVFSDSSSSAQMSDCFSDVLQFAGHVSKLLVNEIQRRAANRTKRRSVIEILHFLVLKPNEQDNKGWNLITALKILANGEIAIIECMVAASLPSTLVKTIRLFFWLKEETYPEECINGLKNAIIPILTRICQHPITTKELIRTDDLATLFDALTCSCDRLHLIWRAGISEILTAITRSCLTKEVPDRSVIDYIEEKKCVSLSIYNIKSICVRDPPAVVEMLVTLICVLRDSAEVSPALLDNFKACGGYTFLSNLLVDFYNSDDPAVNKASRNLVILVKSLALAGHETIKLPTSIESPFQQPGFRIPVPAAGSGVTLRNLDAFKVLQETFLQTKDENLCLDILHSIESVFTSDSSNFFVLSNLHTLVLFIEKAPIKPRNVQMEIFKLVEFVALHLRWVPTQELMAIGILFKDPRLKCCQSVALHTLIRLINQNERYKDVYREVGLLEVLTSSLREFSDSLKEKYDPSSEELVGLENESMDQNLNDFIFLLMECIRLLVENNNGNASLFRQCRGAQCSHNLILFRIARPYSLKIIQQLIVDGGHDDLSTLLGLMHNTQKTSVKLKIDVLNSMLRIFAMNSETRTIFQEVGGFAYVVVVLVSLEGSLCQPAVGYWANVDRGSVLELIWAVFQVLTAAMQDEPINKVIFMDAVRFKGLTETLKLLGCFNNVRTELPPVGNTSYIPVSCLSHLAVPRPPKASRDQMQMTVFKCLTSMACSSFENWDSEVEDLSQRASVSRKIHRVIHAGAISAVVELLPSLWKNGEEEDADDEGAREKEEDSEKNLHEGKTARKELPKVLVNVISQLQHILGSEQNQQMLCEAGLPLLLLIKCKEAFMDDDHPLNAAMTKLFERLTSQSVEPDVFRTFLRLGSPLCCSSPYAMLRSKKRRESSNYDETDNSMDLSFNESFRRDEKGKKRAMSLRILDGNIRISCNSGRNSPVFVEENEIDSFLDENSDDNILNGEAADAKRVDSLSLSSAIGLDANDSETTDDSSTDSKSLNSRDDVIAIDGADNTSTSNSHGEEVGSMSSNHNVDQSESSEAKDDDDNISNVHGLVEHLGADDRNGQDETDNALVDNRNGQLEEKAGSALNDNRDDSVEDKQVSGQSENEKQCEDSSSISISKRFRGKRKVSEGAAEDHSTGRRVSRLDSIESSRMLSSDEVETEEDYLQRYFDAEIARPCERLEGEPPSQNIIKCLVSLTTPRDLLAVAACEQPAFVEFDMSYDGFGYLFVGSVAPMASSASFNQDHIYFPSEITDVSSLSPAISLSTSDRSFPPPIGLTFAAWIFIERLPASSPVNILLRLFTIQRRWSSLNPTKRFAAKIFSIYLDLKTKEIVVTTDENTEPSGRLNFRGTASDLRAKQDQLFTEGNWNHLCVVLNKSVVRKSTASIYVNGNCVVSTSKFRYIDSRSPSGIDFTSSRISAFFGTHASNCHISDLIWRLGPSCLLEEPLTDDAVGVIHKLGPSYKGCFQAPVVSEYYEESGNDDILPALVTEDKVTFVFNACNIASINLAKMKSQYSSHEARIISEETCIAEDDRVVPINIIYNSALCFQGPARAIGACLVGSTGIRTFCPYDVASAVMSVGGMSILLSLVAMASNLEELYASLKALTCIVQSSKLARREMVRVKGYQVLGYLLKKKTRLLNTHILHLIFSLVGTVRSDQELGSIPNVIAFNDLLCDLEIWHNALNDLEKSLFCHFYELLTQGAECGKNAVCLRWLDCVPKLLFLLQDGKPPDSTLSVISNVLSVLLSQNQRASDLLRFGQFLASSLPSSSSNENLLGLEDIMFATPVEECDKSFETGPNLIKMRIVLLDMLLQLLHGPQTNAIDITFCEHLHEVLGFDWLMLFLHGHVHKQTVTRATRILFTMLYNTTSMNAFKNATSNGGWLKGSSLITNPRPKYAAGFAVPDTEDTSSEYEVNNKASNVRGFRVLMNLLEDHTDVDEIYYLLFALLLGYPISYVESGMSVSLDKLYLLFWPAHNQSRSQLIHCQEASLVLLHMLRKMMHEEPNENILDKSIESQSIPAVVIQFLEFLYSNVKVFTAFCTEKKFLQYLSATLYPLESKDDLSEDPNELEYEPSSVDPVKLTSHPCRIRIINFLERILMDGVIMSATKASNLLDNVLEAFPMTASIECVKEYQSSVMLAVIHGVLDGNLLQISSKQSLSKFASNINSFASRLIDKLWMEIFSKDYEVIFGFLLKLIEKYEATGINAEFLYKTMNRAILYHLSRPQYRITDETSLLEFLHLLTSNSKTVFSPNNRDYDFISCLTHWLLVIGLGKNQNDAELGSELAESEERESIEDRNEEAEESSQDYPGFRNLVSSAAERVWDVFYQFKKEEILSIFRVQAPSFTSYEDVAVGVGRSTTIDMESAKKLLGMQAMRTWMLTITSETRKKNEAWTNLPQNQTQSRNPVARISLKFKKDKDTDDKYTPKDSLEWSFRHLSIVKALTSYYYHRYKQDLLLNGQAAEKNWISMEKELLRERGIWGPEKYNPLDKWQLETTEGPCRMRKLLCKHEQFYTCYPYIGELQQKELIMKHRTPYSYDSELLYHICQKYLINESDINQTRDRTDSFTWSPKSCTMEGFEGESLNIQVNNQTIVQLLETGEKIYSMYRCARLRGLDSSEGLFLFGRGHFYVIDGFTLLSTEGNKGVGGDICDIGSLAEGTHEPLIPVAKGNSSMERSFSKWSFEDIKEVHKRRYLQQNIAMEIFSNDGNNHLLVFPKKVTRDKVLNRLMRVSPTLLRNAEESVAGMRADADVEAGYGFFGGLIGEKHVTQRWERGEISNFQYLMFLNTLAGRSYNDLMQYPIFPWIIADYNSEELDLTNEKTFRVLSKPMGAQTDYRLKQFQERYRNWEDPLNKTPAYYYGTHYSSAMIVASYLIRLEPFTEQFLRLQGGHFDLPDRLFHSIKEAWYSASEHTMADVKELIPEFFYLPEFLENSNKFDLGRKQSGEQLGDVVLPPWAKGDAREFIRAHREALECDYVSAHLHEWIDLIFGYKQQGEPAIEAHNVFYHMFYEGAVDLSKIKDPLEKKSTIAVINNFGQMPKQLFKRPHPCKKTLKLQDIATQTGTLPSQQSSLSNSRLFFNNLLSIVPSVQPVKELRASVGQIVCTEKNLFAVEANKVLNVFEDVLVGRILCAASLDHGSFVTGGTNTALCIHKVEKYKERGHRLKLIKILYGHRGSITSVATSLTYNIIVSGSEDKTAIVWDVRKLSYIRQLPEHPKPVTCISINNLTGDIITCSFTWIYVWSINGTPLVHANMTASSGQILACTMSKMNEWNKNNVIVTGSADGVVRMWSIEFYDDSEQKEDIEIRKNQSSGDLALVNQSETVDENEDGCSNDSLQSPRLSQAADSNANNDECPIDGSSKIGKLVSQVSVTSSNKTEESFILVDRSDERENSPKVWRRRLVARERCLTMHTAFKRKDNLEPAPITALAISKDHRKIFVGDGRGRIYSWSVSDSVGSIADHWVKDEGVERCSNCDVKFTLAERRHHCRKCGKIFCSKCTQDRYPVAQLSIFRPVRVCKRCFTELKGRHKKTEGPDQGVLNSLPTPAMLTN
eukprot:gene12330-13603_t